MLTGDVQLFPHQDRQERRRDRRKKTLWPAKLETPLGCVECQVLNFTSRGAKVRLLHVLAPEQSVSLILDPLGRFPGVVVWRRNGCTGIRFTSCGTLGNRAYRTMREASDKDAMESVLESASGGAAVGNNAGNRQRAGGATTSGAVDRKPATSSVEWSDGLPAIDHLQGGQVPLPLEPGQVLFKEGDPGGCMYVVKSGSLRIRSGQIVYEDVERGDIVGEMGIIDQRQLRSATVYALTRSEVVQIDEERFLSLVNQSPEFAIGVMRVLSRRLRNMDQLYRPERSAEPHR
jgi:CRP/FNR family transcriptional regulator, cyclic AMP receptor protein